MCLPGPAVWRARLPIVPTKTAARDVSLAMSLDGFLQALSGNLMVAADVIASFGRQLSANLMVRDDKQSRKIMLRFRGA